jgi:hypothetical protein
LHQAESHKIYVAGIDLAGEAETGQDDYLKSLKPRQDSTVVTIGELDISSSSLVPHPSTLIKIVEHYDWTGQKHTEMYPRLIDILKNVWHCRRIVVDATGIGQPIASFLRSALGGKVAPFVFTSQSKSELGFNLLAAVNAGGLKMYARESSKEYQEFWYEMEKARSHYRPSQTMNFFVDPSDGHDDYLTSLALLVEAAGGYSPREARGS